MKKLVINGFLFIALTTFTTLSRGCCSARPPEPAHPGSVAGWNQSHEGSVDTVAMLVLKQGESSDNGRVGVKVVEIIAGDPCAGYGTLQSSPRVRMQFYQPSHQKVLCEELLTAGSGTSLIAGPCRQTIGDFGITAISTNAINATDGWVWFELR